MYLLKGGSIQSANIFFILTQEHAYQLERVGKGGRQRGRETSMRERNINAREKHQCERKTSINRLHLIGALTGDQTYSLGVCLHRELKPIPFRPFALQDDTPTD